jgi:nucleoside-triphosphatase
MKVAIISGERGEGKTTFLKKAIKELHLRKRNIYGFYAENIKDDSDKEGYRIYDVSHSSSLLLCKRNAPETGGLNLLEFWFNEDVIVSGEQWLRKGFYKDYPVFVLDEVGKFELDGFVWDSILKQILKQNSGTLIITVRNRFVKKVMEKYQLNSHNLITQENLLFTIEFVDKI